MPQSITTFLMFEGQAGDAMRFYMSLFPKSEIVQMSTYGPDGPGRSAHQAKRVEKP
jgi:predicted 3-demethylubiquinone-9 3-methyltransferase (glyoxalase superfamily)